MSTVLDTLHEFHRPRIAVVGNSPRILERQDGAFIDGHDTVIRFNFALPDDSNAASIGRRTDVMIAAKSITSRKNQNGTIKQMRAENPKVKLICRAGHRAADFHFPPHLSRRLTRQWGAEPSSGLMVLYLLLGETKPKKVTAYGFDGLKTRPYYRCGPVHSARHKPAIEQEKLADFDSSELFEIIKYD